MLLPCFAKYNLKYLQSLLAGRWEPGPVMVNVQRRPDVPRLNRQTTIMYFPTCCSQYFFARPITLCSFVCFTTFFLPVLCHTLIQALFYFYLTLDLTFITLLLLPSDTWNMPFDSSIGGQSALFIHIILFPFKQICCTFFAISFSLKEGVSQEAG